MEIRAFELGTYLSDSSNNNIYNNNITNNERGIELMNSPGNILRNNSLTNNSYNFAVLSATWYGFEFSHFVNDVDVSNTVDGKPVYYWVSKQDMAVPLDAGYVVLVGCTGITVQNLNLKNNMEGVLLVSTKNTTITKNKITNSLSGVMLIESSNNSISGNSITNNYLGVVLGLRSSGNTVSGNKITNNYDGLAFVGRSNVLYENSITNNCYGVYLSFWVDTWGARLPACNNKFYHNNFIDNTQHVYFEISAHNFWDDDYPSGGNYWTNYTDVDLNSGPYQNETGSDGIGDTSYAIDENNQDNYPLMKPWGNPYIPGDLNHDFVVNIADIFIAAKAFGSKPGDLNWNAVADLNKDGVISIRDIYIIAKNYGKTY